MIVNANEKYPQLHYLFDTNYLSLPQYFIEIYVVIRYIVGTLRRWMDILSLEN